MLHVVCLFVCLLAFIVFFCFASGNGSVMTYNVWLSNILELTTIVVLLQLIYLKFPKIYSSMESIIKEYLSTIQCYTDISCLGGVFAKNTSRETKNIPSQINK